MLGRKIWHQWQNTGLASRIRHQQDERHQVNLISWFHGSAAFVWLHEVCVSTSEVRNGAPRKLFWNSSINLAHVPHFQSESALSSWQSSRNDAAETSVAVSSHRLNKYVHLELANFHVVLLRFSCSFVEWSTWLWMFIDVHRNPQVSPKYPAKTKIWRKRRPRTIPRYPRLSPKYPPNPWQI